MRAPGSSPKEPSSSRQLAAGTRLGPYEVVSLIGAGSMGEVYKARDTRLERTVAVKVLPADVAADPRLRTRFEREARAISSLSHPHICALYDVGEQDGRSFLVMEYLEGETLTDRLAKGPLPLDQALRHAAEIAEALAEAHQRGVVHRDLKPGNVMLTKKGAKLLDFGIAKLRPSAVSEDAPTATASALTREGQIVGTPQYMAPEQLEGKQVDARTPRSRPISRPSSSSGRCRASRARRAASRSTTPRLRSCASRTARSGRSRPRAWRRGPQELQSLRDQRQRGQHWPSTSSASTSCRSTSAPTPATSTASGPSWRPSPRTILM